MGTFIDRNPDQMMKYAKEARAIIGEMTIVIRKVEGLLEFYSKDLDDSSQKQIQELHKCCTEYFKQISVYQSVADNVYNKGKLLNDIRNGG